MSNFKKIVVYSNWCYVDRLEGEKKDLEAGWYRLLWPNGVVTKERIAIEERIHSGSPGHGGGDITEQRAVAWIGHNGAKLRAYLNEVEGLELERV